MKPQIQIIKPDRNLLHKVGRLELEPHLIMNHWYFWSLEVFWKSWLHHGINLRNHGYQLPSKNNRLPYCTTKIVVEYSKYWNIRTWENMFHSINKKKSKSQFTIFLVPVSSYHIKIKSIKSSWIPGSWMSTKLRKDLILKLNWSLEDTGPCWTSIALEF